MARIDTTRDKKPIPSGAPDPRGIHSRYQIKCLRKEREVDITTKAERRANPDIRIAIELPECPPACLTQEEYERQMLDAGCHWRCPLCGECADFNDEWYEQHSDE